MSEPQVQPGGAGFMAETPPNAATTTSTEGTPPSGNTPEGNTEDGNTNVEHDYRKRFDDSQRYITELKGQIDQLQSSSTNEVAQLKARIQELEATPSNLLDESQLEAFAQENPELYTAMASVIHKNQNQLREVISKDLDGLKEMNNTLVQTQALKEVLAVHEDAFTVRDSDEFKTWYATKPPGIQKLFDGTVGDVIEGISLYKQETAKVEDSKKKDKDKKTKQSKDAESEKVTPPVELGDADKVWKESEVKQMSITEYAQYKDDIDKAIKEGRFVFDMSKKR